MKKENVKRLIGVCSFFIMVLLGIIIYLVYFGETFDPNKHDCVKWDYSYGITSETKNSECAWADYEIRYFKGSILMCRACLDWEDKSFCELHPNDEERCVCLEYEQFKKYKSINCKEEIMYYYQLCMSVTPQCADFSVSRQVCDYVEDGFKDGSCIRAREKTLEDLSCEDLEDLFNNGNVCVKKDWWGDCVGTKYPFLEDKRVVRNLEGINKHSVLVHHLMDKKNCFSGRGEDE